MAKLHGLTMGLDVCATFHMGIAPARSAATHARIVERAAPAYLMAVAGNADPMLGYLTTSFREHPPLAGSSRPRHHDRDGAAAAGARRADAASGRRAATVASPLRGYMRRPAATAHDRARSKTKAPRQIERCATRGFDLGCGPSRHATPIGTRSTPSTRTRGTALYAALDDGVISDATPQRVRVRTPPRDRDDYLAHPPSGESICDDDARAVAARSHRGTRAAGADRRLGRPERQRHQRESARSCCRRCARELDRRRHPRRRASTSSCRTDACAPATTSARSSTPTSSSMSIGERPGTGLDTLSAYLTYGRDAAGRATGRRSRSLRDNGGVRHPSPGKAAGRRGGRNRAAARPHRREPTIRSGAAWVIGRPVAQPFRAAGRTVARPEGLRYVKAAR